LESFGNNRILISNQNETKVAKKRDNTHFDDTTHNTIMFDELAPAPASASALPPGVTDPDYVPLPGRLGNLTVPQQHALEKIKKEVQDEGAFVPERMDDATLLR
jgi:hypothetical protein